MRDPVDPKTCIHVAGSFDRITELLAQYLHANTKNNMENTDLSVTDGEKGKRFKVILFNILEEGAREQRFVTPVGVYSAKLNLKVEGKCKNGIFEEETI